MEKTPEISLDLITRLYNGEGVPVIVQYIYKWLGGTETKFVIGNSSFTDTPGWLRVLSEEKMQNATILEVINAPKHLKGEWKQVFDKHKNVIVKYFPTEEEKERRRRINEAYEDTLLMGAVVSSLGRR